jgi:chromosome segregation ATPase
MDALTTPSHAPISLTKKIITLTLLILSVAFFLASITGVILTWTYNQRLSATWTDRLETIETDLRTAQSDLQAAKAELDSVQQQIDALQAALETLGIDGAASLQAVAEIVGRLESSLTPFITQAAERVKSLRDAVLKLKEALESLNQLPLVELDIPGVEQLDAAALNLENLQKQIEEGGSRVSEVSQLTQDTVDSLTTGFAGLEQSAKNLSESLGGYDARISTYLAEIDTLQSNLPRWLDIAAVALTIIFFWLGFSQLALFVLAWSFYSGQDLMSRWR